MSGVSREAHTPVLPNQTNVLIQALVLRTWYGTVAALYSGIDHVQLHLLWLA